MYKGISINQKPKETPIKKIEPQLLSACVNFLSLQFVDYR